MLSKFQKKELANITDYRNVFGTKQGKRVLYDLMMHHFVMGHTFNPANSQETAFNEGQRNVVLRLMAKLKIDPKLLLETYEQGEKEHDNDREY